MCGDAARMAKDVDAALHEVVEKIGGKTPEQAKEYIDAMKKAYPAAPMGLSLDIGAKVNKGEMKW